MGAKEKPPIWKSSDGKSWIEVENEAAYLCVLTRVKVQDLAALLPKTTIATRGLTRGQRDVLGGICAYKSNKEIAAELCLSERTVKYHISELLLVLGLSTRYDIQKHFVVNQKEEG